MNLVSAKMPNQLVGNAMATRSEYGIDFVTNEKFISINGTENAGNNHSVFLCLDNFNTVAGHKYIFFITLKNVVSVGNSRVYVTGNSSTINLNGKTDGEYSILFTGVDYSSKVAFVYIANQTLNFTIGNMMLIDLTELYGAGNEPSTVEAFRADYPLDYYPYSATSYTGLLKQNGKLVSTDISQMLPQGIGVVDLGSLNWVYYDNYTHHLFNAYRVPDDMYFPTSGAETPTMICSIYKNCKYSYGAQTAGEGDMLINSTPNRNIQISNDSFSDATTFKTAMAGVLLFYKKATT